MQVVAAAAMEAPAGGDRDDAQGRDRVARLPRDARGRPGALRARAVRGLPRRSTGVAADSTTETYAALRLEIDNWRWSGVPFFIRTGKHLPVTQTELRLVFKQPAAAGLPRRGPGGRSPTSWSSSSTRRPASGCSSTPSAATRRSPSRSTSTWSSPQEGGEGPTPYEVLLHAAMIGDSTRFTRQDGVEETWRIMQPLLDAPPPVHPYAQGSWGPAAADELVAGHGGWHGPWIAS